MTIGLIVKEVIGISIKKLGDIKKTKKMFNIFKRKRLISKQKDLSFHSFESTETGLYNHHVSKVMNHGIYYQYFASITSINFITNLNLSHKIWLDLHKKEMKEFWIDYWTFLILFNILIQTLMWCMK
jgi:hypothetical protein